VVPFRPLAGEAALKEFFFAVRIAAIESDAAVTAEKPALARLAAAVSGLLALDWSLRKDLCAVLLAFGHGEFGYDYMKSAFEQAGDRDARWFLGAAHDPREQLREALAFAKPGPVTNRVRSE
jgi:hypothetical protein